MFASVVTFNELHERVEPMDALVVVDNEIHETNFHLIHQLMLN